MNKLYYCYRCEADKPHAEMHSTQIHAEQICKPCNVARAGERHLARAKAKRDEFKEQQTERKENKKAKARQEVEMLLSGALLTRGKPSAKKVEIRRAIEKLQDKLALNKLIGDLS